MQKITDSRFLQLNEHWELYDFGINLLEYLLGNNYTTGIKTKTFIGLYLPNCKQFFVGFLGMDMWFYHFIFQIESFIILI